MKKTTLFLVSVVVLVLAIGLVLTEKSDAHNDVAAHKKSARIVSPLVKRDLSDEIEDLEDRSLVKAQKLKKLRKQRHRKKGNKQHKKPNKHKHKPKKNHKNKPNKKAHHNKKQPHFG